MLQLIEGYHPEDGTAVFIMLRSAGNKGLIESESPNQDFVIWPEEMIDDFLDIANTMEPGEIASYGMCITECIFCDVMRERLRQK